jgi:predicted metal-dependent hydrolase
MSDEIQFKQACDYFDKREFFEAHEVWEDLWHEAHGARHAYLQCLIQVAVALHHAGNENWAGTRKLCASALGYLEKGRSEGKEVDLDKLKDHILDFEIALQKILAGEKVALPIFKLPYKK